MCWKKEDAVDSFTLICNHKASELGMTDLKFQETMVVIFPLGSGTSSNE